MTARRTACALAAALALPLAACGGRDREAVRAVRAYDDALAAAFRTGDVTPLRGLAGAEEERRVAELVRLKAQRRVVLESTLESFDALRVDAPSRGPAEVDARERWRYVERPLDPGAAAGAPVVSAMTMRYHLVVDDGRLVVESVRSLVSDGAKLAPPVPAGR